MAREHLECVEINPDREPAVVILWLHGLGADGHDFEAIVPELRLPDTFPIRYVFPHAPMRPVTINFGMVMRAWYDIRGMDVSDGIDMKGFLESVDHLRALIQRELDRGVPSERILLAGFSQGGAIALHTGLRYEKPLRGMLGLSTYLPTATTLAAEKSEANESIPIFMAHGKSDPLVSISRAIAARHELKRLNYPVEWHEYPMEHQVCLQEIEDIRTWLLKLLDGLEPFTQRSG